MRTFPLPSMTIEEARQIQFKLVDCITNEFSGNEAISRGDLGVKPGLNKPNTTMKAERAIAKVFDAEAAVLVRGAGTNAIRSALTAVLENGSAILVHSSPVYPTTAVTFEMMGLKTVIADFNSGEDIAKKMEQHPEITAALIQYTRQKPDDCYILADVIHQIKCCRDIPVITDDNYAAMKVPSIGVQLGADLSCFSTFKLLGPEGIGCVVGKKKYVDIINKHNYSGGSQTQGHEAMDILTGLIYAPVALAIQAEVVTEVVQRLSEGEVPHVKNAFIANAQSKVILVELDNSLARDVLIEAEKYGAAPNPVGAESKYEFVPMFYRASGTFIASDPSLADTMLRINPMRSGAETIIKILKKSIQAVWEKSSH